MVIKDRYNNLSFEVRKKDLRDRSVQSLLAANLIIIIWAMIEQWDLGILMWVYWTQSVIIGLFWFLRIITQKNLYYRNSIGHSNQLVEMNIFFRFCGGIFFLLHYGFFHFVYFQFLKIGLFSQHRMSPLEPLIISGCVFLVNQFVSFLADQRADADKKVRFNNFMSFPYVRIIPLHMTIIFGGFVLVFLKLENLTGLKSQIILLVFLLLKTAADVSMYVKQKKGFDKVPDYQDEQSSSPYPQIKKTKAGEVLLLDDGRVVTLADNPELAKKIKAIEKFPRFIQQAVYEKLLSNEKNKLGKIK